MYRAICEGTAFANLTLDHVPTKSRPRFNGHVYISKATREAENAVREAWREQVGIEYGDWGGEVRVAIRIERPLAKSNPKTWVGKPDMGKPDLDNTAKLILDALNGIAYADDKQVTSLSIRRMPRTEHRAGVRVHIRISYYGTELA